MRAVVQRVSSARVTVKGHVTGQIAEGLTILLGVGRDDTSAVAASMAAKIANLRIFENDQGKMNRSLLEVKGSALVVSQFTLYGEARGQRRPSFIAAAPLEQAKKLYEEFAEALRRLGVAVATSNDVTGIGQSRPGHNPARLGQSVLGSRITNSRTRNENRAGVFLRRDFSRNRLSQNQASEFFALAVFLHCAFN